MNNVKKNNKGFSLVELIVVVLIMAIIAVSLAPQVMKWVDKSKISTDVSTYDSLVANCQLALTDSAAYTAATASTLTNGYTIEYSGTTMALKKDGTAVGAGDALYDALTALDSSWTGIRAKASSASYKITITKTGTVTKGTPGTDAPNAASVQ